MDKIRNNTIISLEDKFVSKGDNCDCWDRVRYLLPCPCIIHRYPGELPLEIVDQRWRFEYDESKYRTSSAGVSYLHLDNLLDFEEIESEKATEPTEDVANDNNKIKGKQTQKERGCG
jgi:hypothetical protein